MDQQFVARQGAPKPAAVAPKRTVTETQPEPETAETSSKAEVAYWEPVRDCRDPYLIKLYPENYPNGTFLDLARAMIAKLQQGIVASPTTKRVKALCSPDPQKRHERAQRRQRRNLPIRVSHVAYVRSADLKTSSNACVVDDTSTIRVIAI